MAKKGRLSIAFYQRQLDLQQNKFTFIKFYSEKCVTHKFIPMET